MTPARSRRWTRSATAGAERPTRRPSSAIAIRPSETSSSRMRRLSDGVIFAAWQRRWRALRVCGANARRLVLSFGVVLAIMNTCFYLAIDRLPLGTVAAIEFLPVIVLAAVGARSAPNFIAL